jgi:phosphate-selective porin OprO/OprP
LTTISPDRNWGVCGYWWPDDKRVLFAVGGFRDQTPGDGDSIGNGNDWACTTRLTGLPIYESNETDFNLVHVGGAFSQRTPPNGFLIFNPTAVSSVLSVVDNPGSPFLPKFAIATNSYQLYNLQAACVFGPFSLQGEWCAAVVQQKDAGMIFIDGVYIFGSYFLTGEHRGYNLTRGSFDQVDVLRPLIRSRNDPRGGLGAVELAARFSYLDLKSQNLPLDTSGVPGNTILYEATLGVNWYLNSYTRIMFNYTAAVPEKVGYSPAVVNTFGVRTAIFW